MTDGMSFKLDAQEFEALLNRLDGATRGPAMRQALMAGGLKVEGMAKENIIRYDYIDTGATLDSVAANEVSASDDSVVVEVGPETLYAIFGELGINQSPKPFMGDALKEEGAITRAVADELRDIIARAAR